MKPRVLLEMPSLFFSLCFPHKITMLIKFAAKKKKKKSSWNFGWGLLIQQIHFKRNRHFKTWTPPKPAPHLPRLLTGCRPCGLGQQCSSGFSTCRSFSSLIRPIPEHFIFLIMFKWNLSRKLFSNFLSLIYRNIIDFWISEIHQPCWTHFPTLKICFSFGSSAHKICFICKQCRITQPCPGLYVLSVPGPSAWLRPLALQSVHLTAKGAFRPLPELTGKARALQSKVWCRDFCG